VAIPQVQIQVLLNRVVARISFTIEEYTIPENRTDSIWQVVAADTTMLGRSHVWLFRSGEALNSLNAEAMALVYEPNGDVDIFNLSNDAMPQWLRLPVSSNADISTVLDTTMTIKNGVYHVLQHGVIKNLGTKTESVNGKPINAIIDSSQFETTLIGASDSTAIYDMRRWRYAPTLGFFSSYIEEHDSITGSNTGVYAGHRWLSHYQLK
jgi:hypothetical protein